MFSIVIPLYNKELSIGNTLLSVLDQTIQEFEIIIVNDGSTDKSIEKVDKFKDPRIRLINQNNSGVSSSRNRGIKEARYDWVAFLDADDLWMRNHLLEIRKMMHRFPDEEIYATSFKYSNGNPVNVIEHTLHIDKIDNYFKNPNHLIWTSIVVINKSCFDKVGMFNEKLVRGEDKDLWARLGKYYSIIKSKSITAVYRIDAENRSDKAVDILKTFEGVLSIKDAGNQTEAKYYHNLIIDKLKASLFRMEWKSLLYLLYTHGFSLLTIGYFKSKYKN